MAVHTNKMKRDKPPSKSETVTVPIDENELENVLLRDDDDIEENEVEIPLSEAEARDMIQTHNAQILADQEAELLNLTLEESRMREAVVLESK